MPAELINTGYLYADGLENTAPKSRSQSELRKALRKKLGNKASTEDIDVLSALENLKDEIAIMHQNLNYATDDMLIDCYIYELKALYIKYQFYIRLCKERGLAVRLF